MYGSHTTYRSLTITYTLSAPLSNPNDGQLLPLELYKILLDNGWNPRRSHNHAPAFYPAR